MGTPETDEAQAPLGDGRTDPATAQEAPTAHEELGDVILVGADVDVTSEETSARIASKAAHLLGHANPLMRGSPLYGAILAAAKNNGFAADGKLLDMLDEMALVLEPFMRDVRSVAGSALTQVAAAEPGHD